MALAWARQTQEKTAQHSALNGVTLWASLHAPQEMSVLLAEGYDDPAALTKSKVAFQLGVSEIAETWVLKNPQATFQWIESLPDESRIVPVIGAVSAWAEMDLTAVVEWFKKLPPGDLRIYTTNIVAEAWAKKDSASARKWVESLLDDDPLKKEMTILLARQMTEENPETAVAWVEKLPAGQTSQEASREVVNVQFENSIKTISDFKEAVSMAQTLPQEYQESALTSLVKKWENPEETLEWLKTLPQGSPRDKLVNDFTKNLFPSELNPKFQFSDLALLVEQMNDDSHERSFSMIGLAMDWMKVDSKAAKEWLQQTSLPDTVKESILKSHP